VGARNAVQLFYIISGFLISYVLVERKSYANIRTFYLNRYLRLYPMYFAVAALTLVELALTSSNFFQMYKELPASADVFLIFANLFLFGQDWVMFSAIQGHQLVLALDFTKSDMLLWHSLLVPQAWTLGVELSFYTIAPFILFKKQAIWALLFVSLMLRVVLVVNGIGLHDPWTYRFFPTELAFFLFGALAQQLLLPFYQTFSNRGQLYLAKMATAFMVIYSLLYPVVPGGGIVKSIILFGTFILVVPLAFIFQNHVKWDRKIGELSYPIYIGHVLVIGTLSAVAKNFVVKNPHIGSILDVLFSIVFALLLNGVIGKQFEILRSKFKRRGAKTASPARLLGHQTSAAAR